MRRALALLTELILGALLGCLQLPSLAAAQAPPEPVAPAVISRNPARQAIIRAVRLSEPLRVDGVLDEAVYQSVPAIDDFIQSLPKEGSTPSERTEAWIMFDSTTMYVTARCWDSAPPSRWVANEMRRDSMRIGEQDGFSVLFDTFHDGRNGYSFNTSPLGVRSESQVANEGNVNTDWNAIWDVRAGRFEGGWTVEIAIPFKSLRYRSGTAQTWGIQLRRSIRRTNEWIFLTPVPASTGGRSGMLRISLAATLVGLDLPPASTNLEIKPYVTSGVATDRLRTPVARDLDTDFGVDAKYGITANLTADLTYNTDFAQVEVDEQQVNLTRFNLVFPEKREFFLEGRGIFEFGRPAGGGAGAPADMPSLFYSRRIGLNAGRVIPIDVGGRVTGKAGKFALGLMNIQTADDTSSRTPSTNFSVMRVRRDILRRSNIGMMITNRSRAATTAGSNQAYGVDGAFAFFQNVSMSGYWAQTRTDARHSDDISYQGRLEYAGDRYGARAERLSVGANFNPEVGFLRRTDFRRNYGSARFSPRPAHVRSIRKLTWEGSVEYFTNGAGKTESSLRTGHFDIEFNNSDRLTMEVTRSFELLVRPFTVARGVTIPAGGYEFSDAMASYALGQQRRASGTLTLQRGGFYNGGITVASYSGGRVSITKHLSFDPTISFNRLRLPAGNFTTRLYRVRTDYAFSPWMFATALLQFNSADQSFSSNLRFRWEYRPGSEFFAVYTDERDTTSRGFPGLKNRAFVLKINRLLMF